MGKRTYLIIISHGDLANAAKSTLEMISGPNNNVFSLGLYPGEDLSDLRLKINEKLQKIGDKNNKYIFVTDIFGGTPLNAVLMETANISEEVLMYSGLNLPALLEISINLDKTLKEIEGIIDVSKNEFWKKITVRK